MSVTSSDARGHAAIPQPLELHRLVAQAAIDHADRRPSTRRMRQGFPFFDQRDGKRHVLEQLSTCGLGCGTEQRHLRLLPTGGWPAL
jgi:hypothetical protein